MSRIVILGGTGAMGTYLTKELEKNYEVWVTSRRKNLSCGNVRFIKGDAHDNIFLNELLSNQHFVAIVDFMNYRTAEYEQRVGKLLSNTDQLIFLSSSRVYDDSNTAITEESDRLLDVSKDTKFVATDDYALAKARQEDILKSSGMRNWTIIRPYMTYYPYRLDLGYFPKELWLYRILKGRTIIMPKDVAEKTVTLTHGKDVAKGIASIIGKEEALGEIFHITENTNNTWGQILENYVSVIRSHGYQVKIKYVDEPSYKRDYIYRYDRLFNRRFNNSKINKYIDTGKFQNAIDGTKECMEEFLNSPRFLNIDWKIQAAWDRETNEVTPYSEIGTLKNKVIYFLFRHIFSYYKCKELYHRVKHNN